VTGNVVSLRCLVCGEDYSPGDLDYVCPRHGAEGILDVIYDYERIAAGVKRADVAANPGSGMWRYRALLPITVDSAVPPLLVGDTPLGAAPRLAFRLGLEALWVKDEGRQPTASLKDRAAAMAVVKAAERGIDVITTASTGNAAAALSGLCASVGKPNVIFVPASAPVAKVAQLLAYGATVLLVEGTYDQAYDLCLEAASARGWYNRSTAYNPYMSEGKKTVAYEICEQLGWKVPDAVFVSVGDGCIIGGVHKGMADLVALGWIERMPRLFGIQAAGSNYLAEAWERGEDVLTKPPIVAHTVADSISAGLPRDRLKAMRAVMESGGAFITVSDEEILAAIPAMARGCGVFGEPAGAAAYAGLEKAADDGLLEAGQRVVVINSGSGLKDVASARRAAEGSGAVAIRIEANMEALEKALAEAGRGTPGGNR
jgi:threonine synthase